MALGKHFYTVKISFVEGEKYISEDRYDIEFAIVDSIKYDLGIFQDEGFIAQIEVDLEPETVGWS